MTDFLVRIVEGEDSMFVRSFNPRAQVFAAVMKTDFVLIINFMAYRRLKKVKVTNLTK